MNVSRGKESRRRMVSESGLLYDLLGYDSADFQVDLHRLAERRNNVLGFFMPCIFRSRVPFPLSPLCVFTTISPVNLPEAGSSRNAPCFGRKVPCTVWSTEPKVKWMVVGSGASCQELCRSAAEMLTPGEKDQSNRNTFPSWLYFATAIHDIMRLTVPIPT
jgi:hypothetical protein